jgi:hypothetical protein
MIALHALVISAKRNVHLARYSLGERTVELFGAGDAELDQIAFGHGQRLLGQPDIMPDQSAGVITLQDAESQLVPGGACLGGAQRAINNLGDILSSRHRRVLWCRRGCRPGLA